MQPRKLEDAKKTNESPKAILVTNRRLPAEARLRPASGGGSALIQPLYRESRRVVLTLPLL
jgi:hypothetical protein